MVALCYLLDMPDEGFLDCNIFPGNIIRAISRPVFVEGTFLCRTMFDLAGFECRALPLGGCHKLTTLQIPCVMLKLKRRCNLWSMEYRKMIASDFCCILCLVVNRSSVLLYCLQILGIQQFSCLAFSLVIVERRPPSNDSADISKRNRRWSSIPNQWG